jgi:hypothetical protein
MVLQDVFLAPLGLAGALVAIPIILLYLVRPDPIRERLPTYRFLAQEEGESRSNPFVERLRRNLLLLLQVLAVLVLAVSLASPYVSVAREETVTETVLVVDASASMATATTDGPTRFDRAVAAAREEVTGRTSLVVAGGDTRILVRDGTRSAAEQALDGLAVTGAPADLRSAITTAANVAGQDSRVVVFSDFADESNWEDAVRTARARGLSVRLEQFNAGGTDNVGFVGRSFSGRDVTFAVQNFGDRVTTRTVTFGDQSQQVRLEAGDVSTVTFEVPAGGAIARLTPGDSLPADDVVPVAAPREATIDVLLLTGDRNRFLQTALELVDPVELTVRTLPAPVQGEYDVIVFSNARQQDLLRSNVEAGEDLLESGGGVAVQPDITFPQRYGSLALVAPQSVKEDATIQTVQESPLTDGIAFTPPEQYHAGPLKDGRALVRLSDGTPLVATAQRGPGRLLYFGYIESASSFKYNYQYPVFWKRAIYYLAGREPLPALNRQAGGVWTVAEGTDVAGPEGQAAARGSSVRLDRVGYYEAGQRRIGVALLDDSESDVRSTNLEDRPAAESVPSREERTTVPRELTHWAVLAALLVIVGEVGYLRYRGDL